MKRFPIIILAACLFQGASLAAELADPAEYRRLVAGEVVVLDSDSDKPGGTVRVQALAHAPAQAVWDVIVSCSGSFQFVDGLQSCDVIEDSGERALVHQVTKQGWPAPTMDLIYESLREPYSSIRFRLEQGNLKAMEGSWHFINTQDGLLLDYQIRIKPEHAVPDFMVSSSLRKSSPDMVACVRGLAGGSGTEKLSSSDLERCPGKPDNTD